MNKAGKRGVRLILLLSLFLLCVPMSEKAQATDYFSTFSPKLVKKVKKNPRILFIGNSLTYLNDVPAMVKGLCKTAGMNAQVECYGISGHSLYQWAYPNNSLYKEASKKLFQALRTKKWDYVVLQDKGPAVFSKETRTQKALGKLVPMARKAGAQIILYQTWAPKKGHYLYRKYADRVSSVEDYQDLLVERYDRMAEEFSAAVAPVGIAFRRADTILPGVNLYDTDKKHSSKAGSYLAACTIYSTIYKKAATGTISGISNETTMQLQKLAADVTVRAGKKNKATIQLKKKRYVLQNGKTKKITYKLSGRKAIARVTAWVSSNKKVATVSDQGVVTAKGNGTAQITVYLNNGTTATCNITVKK